LIDKLIKKYFGWCLPTKIGIALDLLMLFLALFAILFLPMIKGYSIWNYLAEGADVNIEVKYPPEDNLIRINYENTGGIGLNKIYITYTLGFDEEIYPNTTPSIKVAGFNTGYLKNRGDKGHFTINISSHAKSDCILMKEIPKVRLFFNTVSVESELKHLQCYYKIEDPFPQNVCFPAQINIDFYSKEIHHKKITRYYPVSYPGSKIYITVPAGMYGQAGTFFSGENEEQDCLPYDSAKDPSDLFEKPGEGKLTALNKSLNNVIKLSKKYCKEGLMPPKWCVDFYYG